MTQSFAVTWDYRCPFARNLHSHLVAGLLAGADWHVTFVPFVLGQTDAPVSVWDDPASDSGILALQVGTLLRQEPLEDFLRVHLALFEARHDKHLQIKDESIVRSILGELHVDPEPLFTSIANGSALELVRKEHEAAARDHDVWGVPTFIADDQAAFVRLMSRADTEDPAASIKKIDNIVQQLAGNPDLNEFKHTSIPR